MGYVFSFCYGGIYVGIVLLLVFVDIFIDYYGIIYDNVQYYQEVEYGNYIDVDVKKWQEKNVFDERNCYVYYYLKGEVVFQEKFQDD